MGIDVDSRIRRLEWTNRFLIVISLAALGSSALGRVHAQGPVKKIVADSIETRSLSVVNPTGKQGVTIEVGDDGMVGLGLLNVKGKESIGLLSDPSGMPSLCLAYRNVCRVVIGDVYRGNQREFSIQLRNNRGNPIWMPATPNPVAAAPRGGLRR